VRASCAIGRFITNNFLWSAETIAQIYKQRWQVELFFKWIKQNLKIKSFLGTSENAVMTQVMVALRNYLLLAYLKFRSRASISLQKIVQLLQTNLFSRRPLMGLIQPVNNDQPPDMQLRLALVRN
jgi:putative transposase